MAAKTEPQVTVTCEKCTRIITGIVHACPRDNCPLIPRQNHA